VGLDPLMNEWSFITFYPYYNGFRRNRQPGKGDDHIKTNA
jgi:hypothetical protein